MQADVPNGVLRSVAGKANGVDLVRYLEAADNVGQNVPKDAGGAADPEPYTPDHQ